MPDDELTYVAVTDAAERTGASVSAVRLYVKGGYARTRQGEGPRGTRTEVAVQDVEARVTQTRPLPPAAPGRAAEGQAGGVVELADVFVRFDRLAVQLAEASERAGRAEMEAQMVARQLAEVTAERDSLRERLMASIGERQVTQQVRRGGLFGRRRDREEGNGA